METLINIKKTAEMLGVHQQTLRMWDRDGKFKAVRTKGGHRRYRLSDIKKEMGDKNG